MCCGESRVRTGDGRKTVVVCGTVSYLPSDGSPVGIAKTADDRRCLSRATGPIREGKVEQEALFDLSSSLNKRLGQVLPTQWACASSVIPQANCLMAVLRNETSRR